MHVAILAFVAAQAASAQPAAEKPLAVAAAPTAAAAADKQKEESAEPAKPFFQPTEVRSAGSVTIGGRRIAYRAVAGTLVVHSEGWEDTDAVEAAAKPDSKGDDEEEDKPKAEASMFYAAYFRDGAPSSTRPITFLFNGGPGSSTVWLHMRDLRQCRRRRRTKALRR